MANYVIYRRVSTDAQEESGLGLEGQREACLKWIERSEGHLKADFSESVSGGAPIENRIETMRAISELESGDILLVAKRDRLARSVEMCIALEALVEKRGARVESADGAGNGDNPVEKLMRRVFDVFSEFERDMIRARTLLAMKKKREGHEKMNAYVPYGTRQVSLKGVKRERKLLEIDKERLKMLEYVDSCYRRGMTDSAIARQLNLATGAKNLKGGAITRKNVKTMRAHYEKLLKIGWASKPQEQPPQVAGMFPELFS